MVSVTMQALLCFFLALSAPLRLLADDGWTYGRATNYGALDDPWSIHTGSCGFGYLDPAKSTGWDIAAMSDSNPGFSGSCGKCFEVACRSGDFSDGYGEGLDRASACKNGDASVVVMITDSCPCNYPHNAFSNRRWCCGDMPHLDMSVWAFEKLAERRWGVIAIKYREVGCGTKPWNLATNPSPIPGYPYPCGYQGDARPNTGAYPFANDAQNTNMYANNCGSSGYGAASSSSSSSSGGGGSSSSSSSSSSGGGSSASSSSSASGR